MIKLIIGLANPGERYAPTRHNAGAWFIEQLAQQEPLLLNSKLHAKLIKTGSLATPPKPVFLAIPTTYMNHSGQAVRAISQYYKIAANEILVVHDEIDLPAGIIKLKQNGGHGGHNGLRDIFKQLGSQDFWRLRIGVGRPNHSSEVHDYVLKAPSKQDRTVIQTALDRAEHVMADLINGNTQNAMQNLHTDNK